MKTTLSQMFVLKYLLGHPDVRNNTGPSPSEANLFRPRPWRKNDVDRPPYRRRQNARAPGTPERRRFLDEVRQPRADADLEEKRRSTAAPTAAARRGGAPKPGRIPGPRRESPPRPLPARPRHESHPSAGLARIGRGPRRRATP